MERSVRIPAGAAALEGDLVLPAGARGVVLFAHGSGSSRHSPRNRQVAAGMRQGGLGTLLMDLLTREEERSDERTRELRFDIVLLATRLGAAVAWLRADDATRAMEIGLFGASTGAGAALVAAADRPDDIAAVVSRGGRPDLAGAALARVRAPTLLIVGGRDERVIALNRTAAARMRAETALEVVPGATHLFEEPGTLERVTELARDWFGRHLSGRNRDVDSGRSIMQEDAGQRDAESGQPGGGVGRRDEVGRSGVYPASAGAAPEDAVVRNQGEWGGGGGAETPAEDEQDPGQEPGAVRGEIAAESADRRGVVKGDGPAPA